MMHDYRKTLALIAPGVLASDAEVWMSENCFERLRSALEQIIAMGVEFELQKAVETPNGIDLQYRAFGPRPGKLEAERLISRCAILNRKTCSPAFGFYMEATRNRT
jgi:hypothetical protein